MASHSPGDVIVHNMMAGGSIGSVDIRYMVEEFSVFENVQKPYHSVVIDVEDAGDALNHSLGLTGNNTLDLSFSQPGQEPYTNQFILTNVEKNKSNQNNRVAYYTITGYSPHMTKFPKVQKAYKNKTGTNIAEDLVNTFLSPNKPLTVRDPSQGMLGNDKMPYNINGIQIHKALSSVLSRSKSGKHLSSAYAMFEDSKNLVIDSLENALNTALSSPVERYYQRPLGHNWAVDQAMQNFIILNLREEARVDAAATAEATSMKSQPFDIFTNALKSVQIGAGLASTFFNTPNNIMRPPTFLSQILPERKKFAARMDSQAATAVVALNPALTVGAGVYIETLAPAGDTEIPVPDAISGPFMITESRHRVILKGRPRMQGTTTFRGVRGSESGITS
jgi:hypothetical protein